MRDVVEDRLLAEVEPDHLRHVVVDGLVVGDAGAQRVGDRDRARAVGAHEARDAEQRVGAELQRVDEVVVEAAVDRVHAPQPGGRAHVEDVVAHDEVGGLDQLDAHLTREERVLEVGRVHRAGRPDDDGRLVLGARRDAAQAGEQQLRVVIDRPDAVVLEELRHQARHRHAVLQHVGDARRRADVVLQDLPRAVGVADEVAAGDVAVDAARRAHAVRGASEVRAADDQPPGHDAGPDDLALVVDVVDEAVQRADALHQPALDVRPTPRGQDARDEVERERRSLTGPSSPVASKVMPCWTKIASRRWPAAVSSSGPSRAISAASETAWGRGVPSGPKTSSKHPVGGR